MTSHPEIVLDDRGIAWIRGTTAKVRELVVEYLAYGWDAEMLAEEHSHLSLAQTVAALTFYECHRAEIDREIADDEAYVNAVRARTSADQTAIVNEWLMRAAARE